MKEVVQTFIYTTFLVFEVIVAMVLWLLIGGVLTSKQGRYEELVNSPTMFIVSNLFGDVFISIILSSILTFTYWAFKKLTLLPLEITEKISVFKFFKWQIIFLICIGICSLTLVSYNLLQVKPE